VIAWYCPAVVEGINYGDAAAYDAAIKSVEECAKDCKDDTAADGYAKCYQPKGLAAHNAKRKQHLVPNLEMNIDVAKRAQALAEELNSSADGTMTVKATEKCAWNKALAENAD
jgi:hypothetical protein